MVIPHTHCHFMVQARALRVHELCDDHTPPSCLVTNSLAKMGYRSVNTLVLPDPWLTQGGPVTFRVCALHQLLVRSCDLAHHGLHCSHVYVCTHHSSLQHLHVRCLSLLSSRAHMDEPQCMRLPLAPLSGITLTTRPVRSQLYILYNSYMLVRAPRPLCRRRPPHDSHMVQRLQVPCPAHRPRSVLLIHRFGRAPPALSQMAFCQLPSLRLPRSSPLLPFWSVASLLTLPRPHLWMPLRRLFHTPSPLGTLPRNSRSESSWLHLLSLTFAALRVLD